MHYTYVLVLDKNKFYIGYTSDLKRRLEEHKRVWKCSLLYYEAYNFEKIARDRERKLKYYGSAWRALKIRIKA